MRNIREKRLKFTTDLKNAVEISDIIFLCLPTPPNEDGSADLSYVLDVSKKLVNILIIIKLLLIKVPFQLGLQLKLKKFLIRTPILIMMLLVTLSF